MSVDFTLPEVVNYQQSARFFKDGNRDLVEISYIGSKDTVVKKVTPEAMARFNAEWNAYCDGKPLEQRKGSALSEIGLDELQAKHYVSLNVHTVEELAALNDLQCQKLGHGTLSFREKSRKYVSEKFMRDQEKARQLVADAAATIGPRPAEKYAAQSDIAEVKQTVADLAASVAALVQAMGAKPKRGRPPKNEEE